VRNKTPRILQISIWLVLVVLLAASSPQASDKLQIRIWTDKDQFLVHELIIVYYELKNMSDSDLVLSLADLAEDFRIKDQRGSEYPRLIRGWCPLSDTLRADEIYQSMSEVSDPYGIEKVSAYTCYMQTLSYQARHGSWMKSNTITFEVAEPTGEEKKALSMFARAETLSFSEDPEKRGLAFSQYLNLVEKHPSSVYAPISLYTASMIYQKSVDIMRIRENVWVYTKLIEDYPQSCYFHLAFARLAEAFENLEDKTGATRLMEKLIEKHPDTKISERAEYWLEKIKDWKFE